jgi:hypothetical protein
VFDLQLEVEIREASAQAICGNAGWRMSDNNKTFTCIPRQGKPYAVKAEP